MSDTVFRDPPGRSVPVPGVHDAFAAALRANPGQWAVWKSYSGPGAWDKAGPAARAVRTGRIQSFRPAGDYEATARSENGHVAIYARYVGQDAGHDAPITPAEMRDALTIMGEGE